MAPASINETHAVKDASCGRNAAILAIGTAVPPTIVDQSTYHEYYFRVTNADHHSDESKLKLRRICAKSAIRKRHMCLSPDILKANPSICSFDAPSLSERMEIAAEVIPQMAADAATKAIKEWGRPATDITHLVFTTTTGAIHLPGPDYQLVKLLGLRPTVQRVMIPTLGCFGGVTALRVAKDIAENRRGMNQQGGSGAARVLVVCSESPTIFFNGPSEERPDQLVLVSLFGDGAGAMVVGADPVEGIESDPIFETLSTSQMIIPDTEFALCARMKESGFRCNIIPELPHIIADHIGGFLKDLLLQVSEPHDGSLDWNSFFWVLHPGGRAIVDQVDQIFCLHPEKLEVTRHVLAEYGNMHGATVIFELDEMRRRSAAGGMCSTGEGKELGLLVAMGPGITLDAAVLRSVPHKLAKP